MKTPIKEWCIMKYFTILSMAFIFLSCDTMEEVGEKNEKTNPEMEDCYRIGPEITSVSCSNSKCYLAHASIGFLAKLNDQPCLQGPNANAWFEYRNKPVMPVCYPRNLGNFDGYPNYSLFCKYFTDSSVYVLTLQFPHYTPPASDGWFPCVDQLLMCESTCGNGRVEPWEQCDGPDWYYDCGSFQQEMWWFTWPEESRTNLIRCNNNCQYDFTECYQVQ